MINSVTVVGRCGKTPEMKYFESGKIKTTFSLAVNRPTKEKETDWFDVELWGRTAEIAGEFVDKGSLIAIEGSLDVSKYTDKDGNKQMRTFIRGQQLRLLGSKKDNAESAASSDQSFS